MGLVQLDGTTLSHAEYAVLWHVSDTVVVGRDELAAWVSDNLPNNIPQNLGVDACIAAIASLLRKGLLIELTGPDLEADLARWRAEPLPVSWGVDRRRAIGDVDLTETGFQIIERLRAPAFARSNAQGYNDETPDVIRVFGETAASCERAVQQLVDRIDQAPWHWTRSAIQTEPMREIGAWWVSRFERVPSGFEVVLRRGG